jgi:hypothetical protein
VPVPEATRAIAEAASRITNAVETAVNEASSIESLATKLFAPEYTVGTRYICVSQSCSKIPSLETIVGLGLAMGTLSAITAVLAYIWPVVKLSTPFFSALSLLFYVIFAGCVTLMCQVVLLGLDGSIFKVTKGQVQGDAIGALVGAVIILITASSMIFLPPEEIQMPAEEAQIPAEETVKKASVPTWANRGRIRE